MRGCNFSPGPAALSERVLSRAQQDLWDWEGRGFGVMETSHRSKDFMALVQETEALLRTLLAIPEHYAVLFLQGGATLQFAQIPMNWQKSGTAAYLVTGTWSEKAWKEAKRYLKPVLVAEPPADFTTIPDASTWQVPHSADYLHYCHNETIHGVEFPAIPDVPVPVIGDFSSTLLSRPLEVSRLALLYAGAQKNIGPAGITVVILDPTRLPEAHPWTPTLLRYTHQIEQGSLSNTPPTFPLYVINLVLRDLLEQGGLAVQAQRNQRKASLLYQALDSLPLYENRVDPRYRSWMNVPFFLKDTSLDEHFLKEAAAAGFYHLKGHKVLGGMRASLYNAVSLTCVERLVDFLADFARRYA